ncbi:MAG: hypothetical protein OEX18_15425 [Candidatus Krumholzibacteria bacterium]|nr:hypothetical protein [Candidatus Krumholzibacteria bacterium]MDH4338658.1 hypothetical protein [Candidatus Krumholzibacteria bacterium]MDH5271423.1 hypothetical protein [Candidatus Krumholzibacteria bacterium]
MRRWCVLLFSMLLLSYGCASDDPVQVTADSDDTVDLTRFERLERLAAKPDQGVAELIGATAPVVVPAGSVDALQAAIVAAGTHGIVLLESGLHTESQGVLIGTSVSIIGESGAVLEIDSDADPFDYTLDPALHIKNTANVMIWGLAIRPTGTVGGVAVLVERSPNVTVGFNQIDAHQNAIVLHHGDRAVIWGNRVRVTDGFFAGELLEADGILALNGDDVAVVGNDVSNGLFGIFASDEKGLLMGNTTYENYIGVILCKAPPASFQLPGGEIWGSEQSATRWKVFGNNSADNFTVGYLVIDGANKNSLWANDGSGNGTYDIELMGESMRFGFCTPTSFDNSVKAVGRYRHITIKDCGVGNTVMGGMQVDPSVDPCEGPCPASALSGAPDVQPRLATIARRR